MQRELWTKIIQFDLDTPPGEYSFSIRLAHENAWTKTVTCQAILEYKKFMYLAATTDEMVSPSGIVDAVWHQHLVFTQSYQAFCDLLGKQVQHIPSTQQPGEKVRFQLAKDRTKQLYEAAFGEQPAAIWEGNALYAGLHLPKARYKLRGFMLLGIAAMVSLLVPFFYLLKPLYARIGNPDFLIGHSILGLVFFACLELYNRRRLKTILLSFNEDSFAFRLTAWEVIYLKTRNLSYVVNGVINELVEKIAITVYTDNTIQKTGNLPDASAEQAQVLDTLEAMGRTDYPRLLQQLLYKPVFANTARSMDAFKKYMMKSERFGRLFYHNFFGLAFWVILGLVRVVTGIERQKPVVLLVVAVLAAIVVTAFFLNRLTHQIGTQTLPQYYRQEILPGSSLKQAWPWQYFLWGSAVLTTSFAPLVQYGERNHPIGSSCSTSCGASCGSSCSSCGGCGGGD